MRPFLFALGVALAPTSAMAAPSFPFTIPTNFCYYDGYCDTFTFTVQADGSFTTLNPQGGAFSGVWSYSQASKIVYFEFEGLGFRGSYWGTVDRRGCFNGSMIQEGAPLRSDVGVWSGCAVP